jgi:aspartyl-tRNA(Asn)/glutamyl-tRNA(Gln) amidotransferase subunit C
MPITKKDVEHVARLARLALTEEEKELYTQQLERILAHIGKLSELNTDGVEPTAHPLSIKNVWREDVMIASEVTEELLKGAPEREERYIKVKRILEST